jgi:signal peptidase I
MANYFDWVQKVTENFLNSRKAKKQLVTAQKRTFKSELLSWLDAIVFAVVFVLLINQYLFQLFMIPTPSMLDTLLIKDRVFVSKTSYGVELYPGGKKAFERINPIRDEVIVFYNPLYISKGPLFDILSQVIYMGSFSLINIDVDEHGNMRERLYVKRAALLSGESAFFENGKLYFKAEGDSTIYDENQFRLTNNLSIAPHQSLDSNLYPAINAYGSLLAYQELDLVDNAPRHLLQSYQKVASYSGVIDFYQVEKSKARTLSQIKADDLSLRNDKALYSKGIYVAENHVLPLGDNRDNSQDGRYFGPVPFKKVIGKVKFRFWPLNRMGKVI